MTHSILYSVLIEIMGLIISALSEAAVKACLELSDGFTIELHSVPDGGREE